MNKRIDGLKQAIEMLQALDSAAQQSLLADIARRDPEMAIKLQQHIVTFDDLKYLTIEMMRTLLNHIDIDTLGLALRGANKEVVDHLYEMFSSSMKRDVDDYLKGKLRPLSEVMEAQKNVMDAVLALIQKGEIILDKNKAERYV